MPYPLGTLWFAGSNNDCSQAGTCVDGPCGPGEPTVCPDYWEDVQSLAISYATGEGAFRIGGRTIGPGQNWTFQRSPLTPPAFTYPVEYFRGDLPANFPKVITPAVSDVLRITIENYAGAAVYGAGGIGYRGGGSLISWNSSGKICIPATTSPAVLEPGGPGLVAVGSWTFTNQAGLWQIPVGSKFLQISSTATGKTYVSLPSPSYPAEGPAPSIVGLIDWRVYGVLGSGFPWTELTAVPLIGSPGSFDLAQAELQLYDWIRVKALPLAPLSFTAALTVRSACLVPPP